MAELWQPRDRLIRAVWAEETRRRAAERAKDEAIAAIEVVLERLKERLKELRKERHDV